MSYQSLRDAYDDIKISLATYWQLLRCRPSREEWGRWTNRGPFRESLWADHRSAGQDRVFWNDDNPIPHCPILVGDFCTEWEGADDHTRTDPYILV